MAIIKSLIFTILFLFTGLALARGGPGELTHTYFMHGLENDGASVFSKEHTNCETVLNDVKKLVDFDSLEKMYDDGHIVYTIYQTPLYSSQSPCVDMGANFLTQVNGLFFSIDEIGRDFLESWAKQHEFNSFSESALLVEKIEYFVTHYFMRPTMGGDLQVDYFREKSSYAELAQEFLDFQDAFIAQGKKKALQNFMAPRLKNPDTIKPFLERSDEMSGFMLLYESTFYIDGRWYSGTRSGDAGLVRCEVGGDSCTR